MRRRTSKFWIVVGIVLLIIILIPISCRIWDQRYRRSDQTSSNFSPDVSLQLPAATSTALKFENPSNQSEKTLAEIPTSITVESTPPETITVVVPSVEETPTSYATQVSVTTSSENDRRESKAVQVEEEKFFYTSLPVDKGEKVIMITIDDGPGEYTGELLDLLKELDIKVAFFLNGDTVPWYKEIVKREYEEGHTIGTHTYCHRSFFKLEKTASREQVIETMKSDFIKTENNIKAIIPEVKIRLLRMPEGYYRPWMDPILKEFGYVCINWTAGYDWIQEPDEKVLEYYKKALRPGGIYLFHDGKARGKRAMKLIRGFVEYARAQGYRIADPKEFFGN
ncbi:polysaccharide deacetylase family protein [Fervidobacterium thailandense]|uniref:NodB homology domain-containing protein n=1 Tax=Fervidobacterium thailandense TaxID=1008305 RepID=A0A1E3G5I5_9BACT|nr:polysaccharide deacetylase family protein [Fervidobacterium thailandense]ODN31412.1 hypothetical protein A4H02_01260 [Fervidobacterium thailandense]